MPQKRAVLHLILYITIERGGTPVSGLHGIHGCKIREAEKSEGEWQGPGDLWDWTKRQMMAPYFFYTGKYGIVNSQQLT